MKRKLILFGMMCALGIAACFLTAFQRKPVISVNGDKIYEEEYSFLSHVFTGGTGEESSTEDDKVAFAKIEQQMLKDYGIIEDISYSVFLEMVKEENIRREKAIQAGEKIHGPKEYDARVYYDYIYSEAKERLIKEVLINQMLEEEIQDFAQTNGIQIKGTEDKQQIRYQLAKERCASELKERKNQAVIKED